MEICEDIRQTLGMKDLYAQRKETIERIFGTAKENHGFRYTQMYGKARMEMKVGLTFACMNLKKLAKIKAKWGLLKERKILRNLILNKICFIKEKLLWNVNSRATLSTVWDIALFKIVRCFIKFVKKIPKVERTILRLWYDML